MRVILEQYPLPWNGPHGLGHWARVRENGLRLAVELRTARELRPGAEGSTGPEPELVELFSVFHDACRRDEGHDPKHGARGAELAQRFRRQGLFELDDERFDLLYVACRDHTEGLLEADPRIQICWDADRLDLLRVFITPDPEKLCTEIAREPELMAWANDRAGRKVVPRIVGEEWGPLLEGL